MVLTAPTPITITRQSRFFPIIALVLLVLTLTGCQADTGEETGDNVPVSRELVDLRGRVLTYTKAFRPGGAYTPPDAGQRDRLARGIGRLLDRDVREADDLLAPIGLRVTRLTDTATGRRYDEVAASGEGASAGWGRLYLNADSPVRWSAQVPHPVSDRETESLGLRLLEDNPGGALVLAGAHRRAGDGERVADVAHREDSAFHLMVVELQKRGVPGIQLHGFAESSAKRYDAILSGGAAQSAPGEASVLADRLEEDGLRVCRGWSAHCPLEGTTNVQGKAAQQHHAVFLHLELAPDGRGEGPDSQEVVDALSGLLTTWTEEGPGN
ncbi:hypothetical protein SAMN05216505_103412 [Streptomyces prasinopilosus]|uniref:N-formylglutamate amidohydrolase n=1 Tax=Streptomyces prasinopilosus TaxID=67344 RepID=A0A1G6P4K9_9ACTN|nr:hypothetical protein SAMN05216505_103412 [Streptomyces prasinopilosus]